MASRSRSRSVHKKKRSTSYTRFIKAHRHIMKGHKGGKGLKLVASLWRKQHKKSQKKSRKCKPHRSYTRRSRSGKVQHIKSKKCGSTKRKSMSKSKSPLKKRSRKCRPHKSYTRKSVSGRVQRIKAKKC